MNIEYQNVIEKFKKLNEEEKIISIIEFINKTINSLHKINNDIDTSGNEHQIKDIEDEKESNNLVIIYEKLLQMVKEIEIFSDKISQEFYE